MFFGNKHFGMYEPVTVRSHELSLASIFVLSFFVVAGTIICILKEKKLLKNLIQAYINLHTF